MQELQDVLEYLEANRERHLEELCGFLRIPSISTLSEHKEDMKKAAEWLAQALKKAGLENVKVMPTDNGGNPVVYGDWLHAPGKPTALVYGHYDVQPVDPLSEWETPPFEPAIKDEKLYARGATDDKAQLFMHIKTVEAFLKTQGRLPLNIKFCLEGEEEIASPHLPAFLDANKELLKADLLVISDGPMIDEKMPSICVGLRGLCAFEIEASGAGTDLHSGLYGGGVMNPLTALARLVATFHDADGRVAVEGFYDGVDSMSRQWRDTYASLAFYEEKIKSQLGIAQFFGEKGYSFLERTTARPTLEIHGIAGGYQGEGIKTVIPGKAVAKISCRLVDRQDPEEIMALIRRHIEMHQPPGVTLRLIEHEKAKPFVISPDHPLIAAAARAFESGFGQRPVFVRSGGSIPIVETFSNVLQLPVIMLDFGLPGENMHAPNEHFHLQNFRRGMVTICAFWNQFNHCEK